MAEKTEAQKKAQRKYMESKAPIQLVTTPEKREKIKAHADRMGESVNKFIERAVFETISNDCIRFYFLHSVKEHMERHSNFFEIVNYEIKGFLVEVLAKDIDSDEHAKIICVFNQNGFDYIIKDCSPQKTKITKLIMSGVNAIMAKISRDMKGAINSIEENKQAT